MNDDALSLFASIVSANAADAAATTNTLLEFKDEEIVRLAKVIVDIAAVLDRATVIDRKTEWALRGLEAQIVHAHEVLVRAESVS